MGPQRSVEMVAAGFDRTQSASPDRCEETETIVPTNLGLLVRRSE